MGWLRVSKFAQIVFFVMLVSALAGNANLCAQQMESKRSVVVDRYVTYFWLGNDAEIQAVFGPDTQFITPLEFLRVLNYERVLRELEVVDYQESDIQSAIEGLEKAIEEYRRRSLSGGISDREIENLFRNPISSGNEIVNSVLLPHQISRLRKILLQYEVSQIGLVASLQFGRLYEVVPNVLESKVLDQYSDFLKSSGEENRQYLKDYYKEVMSKLSERQRAQLDEAIGKLDDVPNSPLALELARQDKKYLKGLNEYFEKETLWDAVRSSLVTVTLQVEADGKVKMVLPSKPANMLRLLNITKPNSSYRQLNLNDLQIQEIQSIQDEWNTLTDETNEEYAAWQGSLQEYIEYRRSAFEPFVKRQMKRFKEVLTVRQKNLLSELALKAEVCKFGLVDSLTRGELGHSIGVTENQKKRILEHQSSHAKKISRRLVEQERRSKKIVMDSLTKEEANVLENAFGDDLSFERGNLHIHSLFLDRQVTRSFLRASNSSVFRFIAGKEVVPDKKGDQKD